MTEQNHQTFEIALPTESSLADLMANTGSLEAMLDNLEKSARSMVIDTSTSSGRDAVRALAAKIAKSKVALDKAGLASTEHLREVVKGTNTRRTIAKDRLTALQAEVRKPLTDWETAEDQRKEAMQERLSSIDKGRVDAGSTSEQIKKAAAEIGAIIIDDTWAEQTSQAEFLKGDALDHFAALLPIAEKREADSRELEELRTLRAEQDRKDAEAAEKERLATQEREAEATYKRRAEAEKLAAENAARQAEERAAIQAEAEKNRHAQEIEQAREAERKRIEGQRLAEEAEQARKLDNTRRRNRIIADIARAIAALDDQSPETVAQSIMDGKIPNVKVTA
tara:strand:- start:1405 stop:2418 length:1014 start_codon:yes stop_codon:yes gene_type:complete